MYKIRAKIAKIGWREIVLGYMMIKGHKFGLKMGNLFGLYLQKVHRKNIRVENRKCFW